IEKLEASKNEMQELLTKIEGKAAKAAEEEEKICRRSCTS
ncbi:unnamed protein product, partial [Rotaria sp. Silwood2]